MLYSEPGTARLLITASRNGIFQLYQKSLEIILFNFRPTNYL